MVKKRSTLTLESRSSSFSPCIDGDQRTHVLGHIAVIQDLTGIAGHLAVCVIHRRPHLQVTEDGVRVAAAVDHRIGGFQQGERQGLDEQAGVMEVDVHARDLQRCLDILAGGAVAVIIDVFVTDQRIIGIAVRIIVGVAVGVCT